MLNSTPVLFGHHVCGSRQYMHGCMHPNQSHKTKLFAVNLPLSLFTCSYPTVSSTHPVTGIKLWLLGNGKQVTVHVCLQMYGFACLCAGPPMTFCIGDVCMYIHVPLHMTTSSLCWHCSVQQQYTCVYMYKYMCRGVGEAVCKLLCAFVRCIMVVTC